MLNLRSPISTECEEEITSVFNRYKQDHMQCLCALGKRGEGGGVVQKNVSTRRIERKVFVVIAVAVRLVKVAKV